MSKHNIYSRVGDINLNTVEVLYKFTEWMYFEVKPFLHGNILEIGSGMGTFSEKVIRDFHNSKIFISDADVNYVGVLKKRFNIYKDVYCMRLDATQLDDFSNIHTPINSVLALNILEHVEDDVAVLKNIYKILCSGGTFVILVPAHKFLYNAIDKAIGHRRRYSKRDVIEKILQTDFKIKKIFYFNFLSIAGWYINGTIFKSGIVSKRAASLLNLLTPVLKFIEHRIINNSIGISLVIVLKKP